MRKEFLAAITLVVLMAIGGVFFYQGSSSSPDLASLDQIDLPIEGMFCESCEHKLTKALSKINGVEACEVSLEKKNAHCYYDSTQVGRVQMVKVVESLGYKVPSYDGGELQLLDYSIKFN